MEIEKKEIPIDWEGKKEIVVIKKLTFGERNDIRHESTEIKMMGKILQTKVHVGRFMEISIIKSVIKAPFKIDVGDIRNLPVNIGDRIYEEIEKFNNLGEAKKAS